MAAEGLSRIRTVGSEAGWRSYWGNTEPVRADFWRLWVYEDTKWDWWSFDFDRDLAYADAMQAVARCRHPTT